MSNSFHDASANNNNNNHNNNTIPYKETASVVLNLETLSVNYRQLLIQYKQAVANYLQYLQTAAPNSNTFMEIPGQAFWGTGPLSSVDTSHINTIIECTAYCKTNPQCSGATFRSANNTCFLRTGQAATIPSSASDNALIPQEKALVLNIQQLNSQLTTVNDQILNIINTNAPLYAELSWARNGQEEILLEQYRKLNQEREHVDMQMQTFDNLQKVEMQSGLLTNSNYYSYLIWLILLGCALMLFLYISVFFGTSSSSSMLYSPEPALSPLSPPSPLANSG